ncbi:MAG: DUF6569 family protein [Candidatus Omnitrophota bacterium]|nr:hypothetical protein [Candidatus Omnitrophota bacterium]
MKNLIFNFLCALCVTFGFGHPAYADSYEITQFVESLEVGEAIYHDTVTIIPIYTTRIKDTSRYVSLSEALRNQWLEIDEMGGGNVPEVELTNHSDRYIYIMGGEILTGCKQDRIVGRDVLIRPRSRQVAVPVYCVEQGRWEYNSDQFYTKENLGTANLRGYAQRAGSSAQQTIWNEVAKVSRDVRVESRTRAYQEVYDSVAVKKSVSTYEKAFHSIPHLHKDTIGAIVAVGNTIVSVDIFANSYLFKTYWPKILKSSALTATTERRSGSITQRDAIRFLRRLHDINYTQNPGIDAGYELSAFDANANVNALVYRGSVIHVAAFVERNSYIWNNYGGRERRLPVTRYQR